MRFALLAALTLAACSSDPAPPTDAAPADTGAAVDLGSDTGPADTGPGDTGPADAPEDAGGDAGSPIDSPPVTDTGPTADTADAGAVDSGTDVVRVDGAPCIPACAAGQVCVGGVCEAVDGGADAGAVDSGPPRPVAEPREFQSCEPRGTSCGGDAGVTCVRPERFIGSNAEPRGACFRPCAVDGDCPVGATCIDGFCMRGCELQTDCDADGTACRPWRPIAIRSYCI